MRELQKSWRNIQGLCFRFSMFRLLCTISGKSASGIFIRNALSIMLAIFDWCLPQGAEMADDAHRSKISKFIPANFFWDISVRFLSWEFWDFCRRHDHFRRFPKKSEVFRRRPKSAEGEVIEKTLIHKIRDREEGIVIYSFTHGFRSLHGSQLTYFWKLCQARRQQLTFLTRGYAKRRNGFLLGLRYANVSLAHSGVESS